VAVQHVEQLSADELAHLVELAQDELAEMRATGAAIPTTGTASLPERTQAQVSPSPSSATQAQVSPSRMTGFDRGGLGR
jgi:hypothetical protein